MTTKQHTRRHVLLNAALDELVADWINHSGLKNENFFTASITLKEFVEWSIQQARSATPLINAAGDDISALCHKKLRKSGRVWNLRLYPLGRRAEPQTETDEIMDCFQEGSIYVRPNKRNRRRLRKLSAWELSTATGPQIAVALDAMAKPKRGRKKRRRG